MAQLVADRPSGGSSRFPRGGRCSSRSSARGSRPAWLPIPSSVPVVADPEQVRRAAREICGSVARSSVTSAPTVDLIAPMLGASVPALLAAADCRLLLLGHGSDAARGRSRRDASVVRGPDPAAGLAGPGGRVAPSAGVRRDAAALSGRREQPPHQRDGGALARARARHDEPGRSPSPSGPSAARRRSRRPATPRALAAEAARLVGDRTERAELAARGARLYDERFDLRHTIAALRAHD